MYRNKLVFNSMRYTLSFGEFCNKGSHTVAQITQITPNCILLNVTTVRLCESYQLNLPQQHFLSFVAHF